MDLNQFKLAFLVHLLVIVKQISCHSGHSKLLLVSFDGFRWDYLDKVKHSGRSTPYFDKLMERGVKATIKNTFITKTFPSHYTIATGLYEENHGVVGNQMYDPVYGEVFTNQNGQGQESKWWNNGTTTWQGEPIWLTNERTGEHSVFPRKSGVFFWPGSEAPIDGRHPTHYRLYNGSVPYDVRINTVVEWFTNDEHPINFGALYFEEPDASGHKFGPSSTEILDLIVKLDNNLGSLLNQLEHADLLDELNLIITSDHGMADINNVVYLEDYVNVTMFDKYGHPPVFNLLPKEGKEDEVYTALSQAKDLNVFKKADIPEEYHYKYNRRIMPIVVSAHEGYQLCISRDNGTCHKGGGNHGYNNSLPSMHPFFIAHGPAFKKDYTSRVLNSVDLYALMCSILDVDPAKHDGDINNIKHILESHDNSTFTLITYLAVVAFAATITGVFVVAALRMHRRTHQRPNLIRHRPLVQPVQLNNVYVDDVSDNDGKTHLLVSDDEEIP